MIKNFSLFIEKKHITDKYFPILFGGCVLLALTYYKMKFGIKLMESDSASDILYAYLLSNEGSFILDNWYFSTELRIFDNELLFSLLFKLFPQVSWWTIETIGTTIMNGIIGLSSVFVGYKLGLGCKSLWLFGFALLPYGISEHYYVLMHGCGYYSFAIIEVFLILILFLTILNSIKKFHLIVANIFYLGLSLLIGIQGIRLLANLYLPLFVSSLIIFFYDFYSNKIIRKENTLFYYLKKDRMMLSSIGGVCMAVIGYAVNSHLLTKKYAWRQSNNLQWKEFSIDPIIAFVNDIISNLGYIEGGSLFSLRGLANLASLIICMLVVFCIAIECRKMNILKKDKFIICFFNIALLIHLFIYIFLQKEYKARYMLPFFMLLPHIIALSIKEWEKSSKRNIIFILTVCSIIASINVICFWDQKGNHQNINIDKQKEMANFLVNNGYKYGFSTFWYCNSTIQLSNGKLDIYPLQSITSFEKLQWLCTKENIKYDWPDKVFFIVSDVQLEAGKEMTWNQRDKIIWNSEEIYVFSYNSITELQNAFLNKSLNDSLK